MWYVNPQFVGMGIIPAPVEALDRLVQENNLLALCRITAFAVSYSEGIDYAVAAQVVHDRFSTSAQPAEELADHCWRLLKEASRGGQEDKILNVISAASAA